MNSDANKSNDSLRKLLHEWNVGQPLPPRFQDTVWERISTLETARTETFWSLLQSWIVQSLSHRAIAAGYLAVLLAASLLGLWGGRHQGERVEGQLSREYVQSIDPYQRHHQMNMEQ